MGALLTAAPAIWAVAMTLEHQERKKNAAAAVTGLAFLLFGFVWGRAFWPACEEFED